MQYLNIILSVLPQPGHFFLSRRYALQIPQFMPQGAIIDLSKLVEYIFHFPFPEPRCIHQWNVDILLPFDDAASAACIYVFKQAIAHPTPA
jgi:hypothetical protein